MNRIRHSLLLLIVGFALALGSCGREGPTAPSTTNQLSSRTLHAAAPAPRVVYGPVTFTRGTGKPQTDSASFSANPGDTLTFVFTPGAVQGLNTTVDVNGSTLYSSTPAKGAPDTVRAVARATNTLRIYSAGKPGSSLRIVATVPGPAETRVLSVMYESSVLGARPAGDTALALGSRVHYAFTVNRGFQRLSVVIDGRLAPDSGTLTMDRAHWIAASADTLIALDPTEQPLAQLLRTVLTSSTPREAWSAYQAALEQAAASWGAEADWHLARIETVTIDPVADLANLVRLDSALAGMVTPIEPSPDNPPSLREGAGQAAAPNAAPFRRGLVQEAADTREATQILLVNGILTSEDGLRENRTYLASRLNADQARFPTATTYLSTFYSASLYQSDANLQIAGVCFRAFLSQASARRLSLGERFTAVTYYVACVVRAGLYANDFSVMLRWARDAIAGAPPADLEVARLAATVHGFLNASQRHVLVVGHSRGSVLTQLAVQRLKDLNGFNEEKAPRCIGTVSIAGVGTTNWPLSGRHARFVVAKYDLVTTLPGSLFNPRLTIEDADTRALDPWFGMLSGGSVAQHWWTGIPIVANISIHKLDRYLRSPEMWPAISSDLDQLYRTCAIGAVNIDPPAATLQLTGAASFTATWTAIDGQPLTTTDSVRWSVDSELAGVSDRGRVVAGLAVGAVALQAKVRRSIGTASITIVDDSLRDTYVPPVINSVITRRWFTGYPGGPGPANLLWFMSISASAMPGATISEVEVFRRSTSSPSLEILAYSGPLPEGEFVYQALMYNNKGTPVPGTIEEFAASDFAWFRVVVTDSHGLKTEFVGSSTDPFMLP